MAQATFLQAPGTIDHTPASELAAGAVVVVGNIIGITKTIIPANEMGTINVEGQFRVVKKTGSVAKGDILYWDVDGDPVGGTAGSGAASTVRASGDKVLGHAVAAAGANDETVDVELRNYTS